MNIFLVMQGKKCDYLQNLTNYGLKFPIMHLTYSPGKNVGKSYFVWHVAVENSIEKYFQYSHGSN